MEDISKEQSLYLEGVFNGIYLKSKYSILEAVGKLGARKADDAEIQLADLCLFRAKTSHFSKLKLNFLAKIIIKSFTIPMRNVNVKSNLKRPNLKNRFPENNFFHSRKSRIEKLDFLKGKSFNLYFLEQ